jgi:hypothetical protein
VDHGCREHKKATKVGVLGGALSLACAIHCLLMPLLLPFASAVAHSFWLEAVLLGAAVIVGAQALRHGFKIHGFRAPAVIFAVGIIAISLGNWAFGDDHRTHPLSTPLLVAGGITIVVAHVLNFVWERRWIERAHSDN